MTEMRPRAVRPAPEPLGNFIRPGYNDHNEMAQALAERRGTGSGLVINPVHAGRQLPLVAEANRNGVESVLDSRSLDLASPGGHVMPGVTDLPWAGSEHMHTHLTLAGAGGAALAGALADYVAEHQFTAVLAPTHYLDSPGSPWWSIDATLTRSLRVALDERGMSGTLIYYPVMMKAVDLARPEFMSQLLAQIGRLPVEVDALWLRLHPFGATASGPLALKRYLQICRELHVLGVPLVAEHSGSVGVALLAFGAVGGIESGVTFTDSVNLDKLLRPPRADSKAFTPSPRVYLHHLGAFVDPPTARAFFNKRGTKVSHGCLDATCCPRGWTDMVISPRGHFLRQRAREVGLLSEMPDSLRPGHYMENFLRPASDRATRAAELEPALQAVRKRLDSWRGTLGADLEQHSSFTTSKPASGRRLRRSA